MSRRREVSVASIGPVLAPLTLRSRDPGDMHRVRRGTPVSRGESASILIETFGGHAHRSAAPPMLLLVEPGHAH